jgi:hypothetical protein
MSLTSAAVLATTLSFVLFAIMAVWYAAPMAPIAAARRSPHPAGMDQCFSTRGVADLFRSTFRIRGL